MNLQLKVVCAGAIAAAALAACGGAGSVNPSAGVPKSQLTPYTGPQQLANFAWGAGVMRTAQYVGEAHGGSMAVDVQLRMRNLPGLLGYARQASTPGSALYRHFLTPQQIADQFGASQSDYRSAASYFEQYHLSAASWPQRLSMVVSGKLSDLETAFGTKFAVYRAYGRTFLAPSSQPHFSRVVPVSAVADLVHVNLRRTYLIRASNGQVLGMSPQQLRRAFDFTGAANAGFNGAGINVGVIATGPIWKGDAPFIGSLYKTSVATVTVVPVVAHTPSPQNNQTGTAPFDGDPAGLATPPAVTAPDSSCVPGYVTAKCNVEDGEAQLDTEQIAELAPGSSVLAYLGYNKADCGLQNNPYGCPSGGLGVLGIFLTDDEIQQAIADNNADAISISFGQDEPSAEASGYFDASGNGPGPAELAALKAEGIAVFVSSGDNGAHACINSGTGSPTTDFCVAYPASDPSVVAVGAVNYPMDSMGNLPASAQITAWADNVTLGGDGFGDNSPGTGGGLSKYFSAASAGQTNLSIFGVGTSSARAVPDVSMNGDPLTGPFIVQYANFPGAGPFGGSVGGTSVSAPEMAAVWAVVLQACKATASCATATGAHPWRLGDPKGLIYQIEGSAAYATTFYDVVAGNNGDQSYYPAPAATPNFYTGYSAGKGYDLVTGVGVPFVGHLINAIIAGKQVP